MDFCVSILWLALNENYLHSFGHLNTCSPFGSTIFESVGGADLLVEVLHWGKGFGSKYPQLILVCFGSLMLEVQNMSPLLLVPPAVSVTGWPDSLSIQPLFSIRCLGHSVYHKTES